MYKFYMFEYHNVLKRKFIWINGKAFDQLEEVNSGMSAIYLGIECTECNSLIRNKLRAVRQVVLCE